MGKVLLIDPEEDTRSILRTWLEEDGWKVLEASTGEKGLEIMLAQRPGIVICDLLMPRCNGFRLCRHAKEHPELSKVKIIVSSSRGYAGDRQGALVAGADEYLVKPVDRGELFNVFTRLLEPDRSTFMKLWERFVTPAAATNPQEQLDTSFPKPSGSTETSADPGMNPEKPPEPMRVRFWGVRGSTPTPGESTKYYGGNTSCVEVRGDGEILILDAGSGIRELGKSLVREFQGRPMKLNLLISHTHWDHIQGFPFFLPAYNPANHIHIRGFEGSSESLRDILSSQMRSPYFPITMQQMPGNAVIEEIVDMRFRIGEVEVETAFMNHPGICVGYRITTSCGSVAFLPDNEPYQRLRGTHADKKYRITEESLAYAQKQDEKLIDFIRDVDVLIIDSQYDDMEYQTKIGWGHGCLDDVVTLALMAGVKKLFLFHHDPDHDDDQVRRMVQWARELVAMHGDALEVDAAREGLEIILPHPGASHGHH